MTAGSGMSHRLNRVEWARNERGNYEMTGGSLDELMQELFEQGYNQAVGEIRSFLNEQDDSEMDRAEACISKRFANDGRP